VGEADGPRAHLGGPLVTLTDLFQAGLLQRRLAVGNSLLDALVDLAVLAENAAYRRAHVLFLALVRTRAGLFDALGHGADGLP
jgi:hypothetical protein